MGTLQRIPVRAVYRKGISDVFKTDKPYYLRPTVTDQPFIRIVYQRRQNSMPKAKILRHALIQQLLLLSGKASWSFFSAVLQLQPHS